MLINILILPLLFLYEDPVLDSIYDQAIKKGLPDKYLQQAFDKKHIVVHNKIPGFFARPYEKKSWEVYKKIFVTEKRISGGIEFYKNNEGKLNKAVVDPFIVLSIIGIESNYGLNKGKYSVFNALYTQILKMPKRSNWAKKELIDFLVLCYEDNIPPHSIKGSYAGAFGYGQFIPSSFISYLNEKNTM